MILIILFIATVSAHGYISNPAAQFFNTYTKTTYNGITTESIDPAFNGLKWNDSPENNLKTFKSSFPKSRFKTLQQLFDIASINCGNANVDIAPIPVDNLNSMSWQNDEYREGFIKSHSGPCEVWIDDKRIAYSEDCRSSYPGYPAIIPIDYSSCKRDRCLLHFYWLALHEPNWQLYKQCVPISNKRNTPQMKPVKLCSCK